MTRAYYEELYALYPKAFSIMPQSLIDAIIEAPESEPTFSNASLIKVREYYLALVKFKSPAILSLQSLDLMQLEILDFIDELESDSTVTNVSYHLDNYRYIITYDRVSNV